MEPETVFTNSVLSDFGDVTITISRESQGDEIIPVFVVSWKNGEFKDVLSGAIDMVQYKVRLSEIDLIQIEFQDLVFCVAAFDLKSEKCLFKLAHDSFSGGEKKGFGQLNVCLTEACPKLYLKPVSYIPLLITLMYAMQVA